MWALPRLHGELIERVSEIPGEGTDIWLSASIRVSLGEFAVQGSAVGVTGWAALIHEGADRPGVRLHRLAGAALLEVQVARQLMISARGRR